MKLCEFSESSREIFLIRLFGFLLEKAALRSLTVCSSLILTFTGRTSVVTGLSLRGRGGIRGVSPRFGGQSSIEAIEACGGNNSSSAFVSLNRLLLMSGWPLDSIGAY